MLCIHLDILDVLRSIFVNMSLTDNLVSTNLWPDLGPASPVKDTEEQDADTDDGEDVERITVGIPITIRRNEGYDSEEDIGKEVEHGDWKVGVPWRGPSFTLRVVQVNETRTDESVDPGTGVGVQIGNEVVRRSCRRSNENDVSNEPV